VSHTEAGGARLGGKRSATEEEDECVNKKAKTRAFRLGFRGKGLSVHRHEPGPNCVFA
jgi:hypothetical protein